jgi:hypothetical protein
MSPASATVTTIAPVRANTESMPANLSDRFKVFSPVALSGA